MKRAMVLVILGGFATTAFAGAVKIKDFDNLAPATSPDADGMAILNYASGADKTEVQIILSGLTPNTTYQIEITSPSHALSANLFLDTNNLGHLTAHVELVELPDFFDPDDNGDWSDADVSVGFNLGTATEDIRLYGDNPRN